MPVIEKICKVCGSSFNAYCESRKFCSRKCYSIYWCTYLKPLFEEKRKKAAAKSQVKRKTGKLVECESCGKFIYKTKCRLQHSSHNFCSIKCLGLFRKDKPLSKEHIQKIKKNNCHYWLGKKRHPETIEKMIINSSKLVGEKNGFYGKHHSDATKQILRESTIKLLSSGKMNNMESKIERMIENQLLFREILYVKQYRYKLGVADFWLPEDNIIIHCDGDYWHSSQKVQERDKRQDEWLENQGYTVFRFWEHDILKNPANCIESISLLYKA